MKFKLIQLGAALACLLAAGATARAQSHVPGPTDYDRFSRFKSTPRHRPNNPFQRRFVDHFCWRLRPNQRGNCWSFWLWKFWTFRSDSVRSRRSGYSFYDDEQRTTGFVD